VENEHGIAVLAATGQTPRHEQAARDAAQAPATIGTAEPYYERDRNPASPTTRIAARLATRMGFPDLPHEGTARVNFMKAARDIRAATSQESGACASILNAIDTWWADDAYAQRLRWPGAAVTPVAQQWHKSQEQAPVRQDEALARMYDRMQQKSDERAARLRNSRYAYLYWQPENEEE
jgi:hypothetical protein